MRRVPWGNVARPVVQCQAVVRVIRLEMVQVFILTRAKNFNDCSRIGAAPRVARFRGLP